LNTLDFICNHYNLDPTARTPVEIPNAGRDDLARLFGQLGFTRGAEIGIEQGVYSEVLCRANPGVKLYCVDAWQAYKGYRDHVSQEKLEGFYETTQQRLAPYAVEFIRAFSMDAVKQFEDRSLDFVYIDANHELPFVMFDLIEWSKKVRPGGIVAGHDYYQSTRQDTKNHVVYAVDAYVRSYRIKPWFLLGTKAKVDGEVREKSRSWFWVVK